LNETSYYLCTPTPRKPKSPILETTVNALKKNGHEVVVRDLYALNFQAVLKPEDTSASQNIINGGILL